MQCNTCQTKNSRKWYRKGAMCVSCYTQDLKARTLACTSHTCSSCGTTKSSKWHKKKTLCQECYSHIRNRTPEVRERNRLRRAAYRALNPTAVRSADLKCAYGITEAEYLELLAKQNGVCAICSRPDAGATNAKRLAVDHCHTTGVVRGLLCTKCNIGLGYFNDNIGTLTQATAYLITTSTYANRPK